MAVWNAAAAPFRSFVLNKAFAEVDVSPQRIGG